MTLVRQILFTCISNSNIFFFKTAWVWIMRCYENCTRMHLSAVSLIRDNCDQECITQNQTFIWQLSQHSCPGRQLVWSYPDLWAHWQQWTNHDCNHNCSNNFKQMIRKIKNSKIIFFFILSYRNHLLILLFNQLHRQHEHKRK